MSGQKTTYHLELKERQHEYLVQMASTHGLPDESKALRVLIDFAIRSTEDEQRIFGEIRCMEC